jgi:hypothetical protein
MGRLSLQLPADCHDVVRHGEVIDGFYGTREGFAALQGHHRQRSGGMRLSDSRIERPDQVKERPYFRAPTVVARKHFALFSRHPSPRHPRGALDLRE